MKTLSTIIAFCLQISLCFAQPSLSDRLKKIPDAAKLPAPTLNIPLTAGRNYIVCNRMQIHLARRDYWDDIYKDFGVSDAALNAYVADLTAATQAVCDNKVATANFQNLTGKIQTFRRNVDTRNAERMGVPFDAAFRLRESLLFSIEDRFARECFANTKESVDLMFARFPMTPDLNTGMPSVGAEAALGNCSGGGPTGPTSGRGIVPDMNAVGLQAINQCLADFATESAECNDPAGLDREAAENLIDAVASACADGGASCDVEYNYTNGVRTETITTTVEEAGVQSELHIVRDSSDGRLLSVSGTATVRSASGTTTINFNDNLTDGPDSANADAGKILPAVKPPNPPSYPDHLATAEARNAYARGLMRQWLRDEYGAVAQPFIDLILPADGSSNQCEAFTGSDGTMVSFRRSDAEGDGGFSTPGLIGPEDAIGYCLCKGGSTGNQVANMIGYSCPRQGSDYTKRIKCMVADGRTSISEDCTSLAMADNGGGANLTAMCSAVMQCPPNTNLKSNVINGRLQCGCGVQTSSQQQRNQCASVSCPGIGQPFGPEQSACCRPPAALTMTPRMRNMQNIKAIQLPAGARVPLPNMQKLPGQLNKERFLKRKKDVDQSGAQNGN